jgi:hypothetical protein
MKEKLCGTNMGQHKKLIDLLVLPPIEKFYSANLPNRKKTKASITPTEQLVSVPCRPSSRRF